MANGRLERRVQWATIVGAAVTAGSMVFGVLTYQRTATDQRQAAALGMLQDYLKLAIEHPDLASRGPDQTVDGKYGWFATHALFTAETIWSLVGDDPRWERAIDAVLRHHRGYLEQGLLTCADFRSEFVSYMQSRIRGLKCAP